MIEKTETDLCCSHWTAASDSYPTPGNSYLLGLCTGEFAATAVSVSRNVTELLRAGAQAVRTALRTGLHSLKAQHDVEPSSSESSASWSFLAHISNQDAVALTQSFSADAVSDWIHIEVRLAGEP